MSLIRIFREINSGIISALLMIIYSITCVSLVFNNLLIEYIPLAIFLSLIGCVIMSVVATLGSPIHSNVIGTQDAIAIIVALSVSDLMRHWHDYSPETMLITVLMLIVTMTVFQGIITYLIGHFRLGKIIEYVPFPVLAGFLGGTVALIVVGTFEVSTGINLFNGHFVDIFTLERMSFWIPEVTFSIFMIFIMERYKSAFALPMLMVSIILIYYSTTWILGIPQEIAASSGYLLGPFPDFSLQHLNVIANIPNTQWWMLVEQAPSYLIVTGLGIITMLVNIRSVEVSTHIYMDINKELKLTGLSNYLAGFFGSIGGYHYLSISIINTRLGGCSILSGVIRAFLVLAIALFGLSFLSYLPKSLFVILLLYIGFHFIYDWLILTYFKISTHDYIIIPIIALVIIAKGLVPGVVFGSFVSLFIFAIRCSSINIIKDELKGNACSSYVEYSPLEKIILNDHRESIRLIKLQSYIFYGNSVGFEKKILEDIRNPENNIKYLIIDFDKVLGVDSSTIFSFVKISIHCKKNGIKLIYSNILLSLKRNLTIGLNNKLPFDYIEAKSFDHALETCESDILKNHQVAKSIVNEDVNRRCLFPNIDNQPYFKKYFTKKIVNKGDHLIEEGEETNPLYIIKQGRVEVYVISEEGQELRVKVLNKGTIFGEISLFMHTPRTASIRAVEDCILLQLTESSLNELKQEHPEKVADLYLDVLTTTMERFIDVSERSRQLRL